ncbi:hypothetical protein GCQ56_08160 [Marinifilum sp. N1E240]|uniref:PD-(D/E)XK nuclease family protein n=1 Tax=Marinifilum sp. N1E240 TaxID=2608082 RepID=UPI00128AEE07|nr:PD-(D/E)XK nuclease family protein [Marinifilum sp. N1E240]MPQ46988.1 hypothetical protein [Marinifilum sp. N1E240]
MITNCLPSFYENEHDTTDNGKETILDYNLNWILRCGADHYAKADEKINTYGRNFILALLYGKNVKDGYELDNKKYQSYRIISVDTWRQWEQIDLIAEVVIQTPETTEKYVISIENKMYTSIGNGQLEKYKCIVDEYYKDNDYKPIHVFIKAEEVNQEEIQKCKDNEYKWLTFYDIINCVKITQKTGNYLFDEFWFRYW